MEFLVDCNCPLFVGFLFTGLCAFGMGLLFFKNRSSTKTTSSEIKEINVSLKNSFDSTKDSKIIRREISKCPFSSEISFVLETAEYLPPSPLDMYGDWTNHLATRWLAAGLSGQDTPGYLRAGLKRLRHSDHFLVEEPFRIKEELLLKKNNLDDPDKYPRRFVMETDSVDAQMETLELFMSTLPIKYPDLYTYNKEQHSITVHPIESTFYIDDWKDRPLELCERIVQEDLILMRPGEPLPDAKPGTEGFYMAAAAVIFSFTDLPQKLGKPAEFLHAPVPGYEKHLRRTMNMMFTKLEVEKPLWRNNWGFAPNANLDEPLYGASGSSDTRDTSDDVTIATVKDTYLKVEYQTIRRLPRSRYLLFTVKTMVDPLSSLEIVSPKAALCLASSIRGMSTAMCTYKGMPNDKVRHAMLFYLDSIVATRTSEIEKEF